MLARAGGAIAAISAALLAGGAGAGAGTAQSPRLVAFGSCPDLLAYVHAQAAAFVSPYGLGQSPGVAVPPKAAPASGVTPQQGVDYSGTNVQEGGVDEPDVVKTNGVTLFAAENGALE